MINKKKIRFGKYNISYVYNFSLKNKESLVIMIHGFGSDKDEEGNYILLEQLLAQNNFSTIRFDMPGHGDSSGKTEDYSIDDVILIVKNLVSKYKYNNYYLIGSSYGGAVSVLAAKKLNISKIVLYSPLLDFKNNIISPQNDFCSLFLGEKAYNRIKKFGFSFFGFNDKKIGNKLFEDANKYDPNIEIGNLKSDVLIFHGENDDIVPVAQSKEIALKYDNVKLKIVPKSKHLFYNNKRFLSIAKKTVEYLSKDI